MAHVLTILTGDIYVGCQLHTHGIYSLVLISSGCCLFHRSRGAPSTCTVLNNRNWTPEMHKVPVWTKYTPKIENITLQGARKTIHASYVLRPFLSLFFIANNMQKWREKQWDEETNLVFCACVCECVCVCMCGNLASHTLRRERKGLVTLQLWSCHRKMQLSNTAVR